MTPFRGDQRGQLPGVRRAQGVTGMHEGRRATGMPIREDRGGSQD